MKHDPALLDAIVAASRRTVFLPLTLAEELPPRGASGHSLGQYLVVAAGIVAVPLAVTFLILRHWIPMLVCVWLVAGTLAMERHTRTDGTLT